MTDLADFLLARIDEQETALDNCQDWSECDPSYGCPAHPVSGDRRAELDSVRQIVERACRAAESGANAMTTGSEDAVDWALEGVLRLLALPYADHPDYREEWRP